MHSWLGEGHRYCSPSSGLLVKVLCAGEFAFACFLAIVGSAIDVLLVLSPNTDIPVYIMLVEDARAPLAHDSGPRPNRVIRLRFRQQMNVNAVYVAIILDARYLDCLGYISFNYAVDRFLYLTRY